MPTLNPAVSGSGLPPQDGGILVFGDGVSQGGALRQPGVKAPLQRWA